MKGKYKVAITGNIGSGKSTVCRIFETLGIPVYYSDIKAKKLIDSNHEIMSAYKRIFGNGIYIEGDLDRNRVAELIFKNKELLSEIESIVHPAVFKDFEIWSEEQESPIVLHESAILFECKGNNFMDSVIFVSAPENIRIERVMKRDGLSEQEIRSRMNNQWGEEQKIPLSHYVIKCDGYTPVIRQVLDIYNVLSKEFRVKN